MYVVSQIISCARGGIFSTCFLCLKIGVKINIYQFSSQNNTLPQNGDFLNHYFIVHNFYKYFLNYCETSRCIFEN